MERPLNPELPVQRQFDAYNARDLERFVAQYTEDVQLFRPPKAEPFVAGKTAMSGLYATHVFTLPDLHVTLVNRMVMGNKVVDQEHITGMGPAPVDAVAVYEVNPQGLIDKVWFFSAD
jgi:hypothetical protein